MMHRTRTVAALVFCGAVAFGAIPAAASADDRVPMKDVTEAGAVGLQLTRVALPDGGGADRETRNNRFVAGYHVAGGQEGFEAHIQIPTWSCGANDEGTIPSALSFDVNGFINGGGGALTYCQGDEQVIQPIFVDTLGGIVMIDRPLAMGDVLHVVYTVEAPVSVTVMVHNVTQDWMETSDPYQYYASGLVQIGDNGLALSGKPVMAPEFQNHLITEAMVNGNLITQETSIRYRLKDEDKVVQMRPSLIRTDGTFKIRSYPRADGPPGPVR